MDRPELWISGAMMAVAVGGNIGAPIELFQRPAMLTQWDVSADGRRFLVATPTRQNAETLTVVLNWQNGLEP